MSTVNNSPLVLSPSDSLPVNDNAPFRADDSKRNKLANWFIQSMLKIVVLLALERVQSNLVEAEFALDLSHGARSVISSS